MATKRGFCPYCGCKNGKAHYFDVNPDAKVTYCPYCMKNVNPDEAIKEYGKHVDGLTRRADFVLYEQCNPELAYGMYADILEFEDYNTSAFLGRLLCLLYMSKVRRSYIKEVSTMLESESEQYHKKEDSTKYVQALMKMSNVVDQYRGALYKKLTLKKYFYDEDCLKLYLKHSNEINEFKEVLLKEAKYVSRRFNEQKAEMLVNMLEIKIEEQTEALNKTEYVLVNGDHYSFERMKRNGEAEIKKIENQHTNTRLFRYRMASLDQNKKNTRYIKDVIFRDFTRIIRARKVGLWLFIIFYLLGIGAGIATYFFYGTDYLFYPLLFAGAGLLASAIALTILFVRWSELLRNKKKAQVD